MLTVCRNEISAEIRSASFVSVMVDDTSDVSEHIQAIIFRYMKGFEVFERFWTLKNPESKDAEGLAKCIISELEEVLADDTEKLIAQTYDGAAAMSGRNGGVNVLIQNKYKHAHFIHCYAHQLNLIMKQATSQTAEAKRFFSDLSGIPVFFSRSPQRMAVLDRVSDSCAARPTPTRWNFQSGTIRPRDVSKNFKNLVKCMEELSNAPNEATRREAIGLSRLLKSENFTLWLEFFSKIMPHVDTLSNQLQSRKADSISIYNSLASFKCEIQEIRDRIDDESPEEQSPKRLKPNVRPVDAAKKEVCDIVIFQVNQRFKFMKHLEASKLVNPRNFACFAETFPTPIVSETLKAYPMLMEQSLSNQLAVIYDRDELRTCRTATELLKMLLESGLEEVFNDVVLLLKIVITTPMPTTEAERTHSALNRIKPFLRSTMGENRLVACTMLSAERQFLLGIPNFNQKVIDLFASVKDRRMELTFK